MDTLIESKPNSKQYTFFKKKVTNHFTFNGRFYVYLPFNRRSLQDQRFGILNRFSDRKRFDTETLRFVINTRVKGAFIVYSMSRQVSMTGKYYDVVFF